MDDDISQVLKDFGTISGRFKKCDDEKYTISDQLKSLQNKIIILQNNEKKQNESLLTSRELIRKQQDTIAKLVSAREEIKACQDEILKKNQHIQELEEEKSVLHVTYQQEAEKLISDNCNKFENFRVEYESEILRLKTEIENKSKEYSCVIKELNKKIEEIHMNKKQQIDTLVFEYENQLQMAHAQAMKMRDEFKILNDKNHLNISAYKKKIEELEKNNMKNNNLVQFTKCNNNSEFSNYDIIEIDASDNASKQQSFNLLTNNETNMKRQSCQVKPLLKVNKRKLFNTDTEFLED